MSIRRRAAALALALVAVACRQEPAAPAATDGVAPLAPPAPRPRHRSAAARMVPQISLGKPDGLRLYSVHPALEFAACGFQNGDLIRTVDGEAATPASVVARSERERVFTVGRGSKTVTLRCRLR